MPDVIFGVVVLIIWVSLGIFAVLVFLARHGRGSGYWYLVGAALGPILLPIAAELGPTGGQVLRRRAAEPGSESLGVTEMDVGTTILVALDGSLESDHAAQEAAKVLAGSTTKVILVTVLDPDDAEAERQAEADEMLQRRAAWFTRSPTPVCEVDRGDPAPMILDRAAAHQADMLVLGRRGRGLSRRLLGSVTDQLVRRSPYTIMLSTSAAAHAASTREHHSRADEPAAPPRGQNGV